MTTIQTSRPSVRLALDLAAYGARFLPQPPKTQETPR